MSFLLVLPAENLQKVLLYYLLLLIMGVYFLLIITITI